MSVGVMTSWGRLLCNLAPLLPPPPHPPLKATRKSTNYSVGRSDFPRPNMVCVFLLLCSHLTHTNTQSTLIHTEKLWRAAGCNRGWSISNHSPPFNLSVFGYFWWVVFNAAVLDLDLKHRPQTPAFGYKFIWVRTEASPVCVIDWTC